MSNFKTSASNLQYYEENSPLMQKFTKKINVRIPCSCITKIRLRKYSKIWRSPESWIWLKFLHKFHKYVTLKYIFDYNMKSVIDWIPLLNKHYSGMHHIEKSVIHSQSFIHDSHRIQFLVQSNRCRVFTFMR